MCLKKFASKSSLNGHTKKTHPNQWWLLHPKIAKRKYGTLLKRGKGGEETHDDEEDVIGSHVNVNVIGTDVIMNTIGTNDDNNIDQVICDLK